MNDIDRVSKRDIAFQTEFINIAMSIPGKQVQQGFYEFKTNTPKHNLSTWQTFKRFMWNPDTEEFMERRMKLWGELMRTTFTN